MNLAIITPIFDYETDNREIKNIIKLSEELFHQGVKITIFATTAKSERTFEPVFKKGEYIYKGIDILRFDSEIVKQYGNFRLFTRWLFSGLYSRRDEKNWHKQKGPIVPELIKKAKEIEDRFDLFLIYGKHSYLNYKIAKQITKKKLLFIMEKDPLVIGLDMFKEALELMDGTLFFTNHQQNLFFRLFEFIKEKPSIIISPVGDEKTRGFSIQNFKIKHNIKNPYIIFTGNFSEEGGAARLLKYFLYYKKMNFANLDLVMMSKRKIPFLKDESVKIIEHFDIKDKYTGIKGSLFTVHPSTEDVSGYEIINSIKGGKPFIADIRNENYLEYILKTKAGLSFSSYFEFQEVLNLLTQDGEFRRKLSNRAQYIHRKSYKTELIIERLKEYLEKINK
jgi:hypothetical protein